MTPSNLDYTLPALAKKWNKSENHILGMAAIGDLALFVKHNSTKLTLLEKEPGARGYVQLTLDDVQSIFESGIFESGIPVYYKVHAARWDDIPVAFGKIPNNTKYPFPVAMADTASPPIITSYSDIFIRHDEVVRIEAIHSNLFKNPDTAIYTGQKEIVAAFAAHGRKVTMRQIRNYFKEGLEHTYIQKGQKKIPQVTDAAIVKFLVWQIEKK